MRWLPVDGWRHVLWCSLAQIHVIDYGGIVERFGGQAIWQTCWRSGTPFWSWCAQNVPACSIHLHFLLAVYTHGFHVGCVHGMVEACRAIAVDWCAPCELSAGSATFNFSSAEGHYSVPFEVGELKHATSEEASWMSNLRSFPRLTVSRFMALVRPRAYGSLTGGRHALCSVMHRQSGPSLLCAGQWSKTGLVVACLAEEGLCPRCKEAPENLMHRLWTCWANEQYRLQLNSLVPAAVSFPDSLPHTLARTGIPPAGWDVLSLEEFKRFLNYLWCCAADGTTALAREYRGMPEAPTVCF